MKDFTDEDREKLRIRLFGVNGDEFDREALDIEARRGFFESESESMEQALELSAAGWTPELGPGHSPHPFSGSVAVMSWYWRRPGKRPGKPGRKFLSTNQAHRALKRETDEQ